MKFGEAIEAMKKGKKVARAGWNGKGMYINIRDAHDGYDPYIVMYTAQGTYQPGWLASQPDMLSEDWEVVK